MKISLFLSYLAENVVFGQDWMASIRSGPTSQEFQSASPRCGRPRVHHQWNLFFELPSRKRRSFSPITNEESSAETSGQRSYGSLDRKWFNKAKKAEEALTRKDSQRLVGGHEAVPGSWPWQVFIKLSGKTQSYDCGGSIIDSKWIITAAHCVPYRVIPSRSYVLPGVHEVRTSTGSKRYRVKRVITHEDYGVPIMDNNDIALIELSEPLRFSDRIQPICLPDAQACLPEGTKCAATGWGVTDKTGISPPPNALNEVGLKLIENNTCWNMHSDYHDQLSAQMVCAGYKEGGRDACLGDSGGPLACQVEENGPWMLYGITSWGIGCGDPLHPGVYARVTALIDWITKVSGVEASIFGSDWGLTCSQSSKNPEKPIEPSPTKISQTQLAKTSTTTTSAPVVAKPTDFITSLNVQKQVELDLQDFESCGGRSDKLLGQLSIAKIGAEYPNGVTCRWNIEPASENQFVEITFKRASMGNCKDKGFGNGVSLPSDYVVVLDENERVIRANICKASGKAPVKVYARKSASVIMHSSKSSSNSKQGFKLRFESIPYIPSRCGDKKFVELLPDQIHHITSINWPAKYNSNAACDWVVEAPLGHVVLAEVVDFWIGGSSMNECTKSHLIINDSDEKELAKICGRIAENALQYHSYTSSNQRMSIDFKSGTVAVKRGFRIRLRAVPSGSVKETRSLTNENISTEVLLARMEKLLGILKGRLQSQQL